jgi:hypothetical protein
MELYEYEAEFISKKAGLKTPEQAARDYKRRF